MNRSKQSMLNILAVMEMIGMNPGGKSPPRRTDIIRDPEAHEKAQAERTRKLARPQGYAQ